MNQLIMSVVVAVVLTGAAAAVMRSQAPSSGYTVGAVSSKATRHPCRSSEPLSEASATTELKPG
jgi:hypothetical protein